MKQLIKLIALLTPYGAHSYFLMFGILLLCGFGLPLPEDIVLIAGGILSARGICDFWITTAVCMAGVLVGDGVVFFLGRRFERRIKNLWLFRRILNERVDSKISSIFKKYGDRMVFIGRFMPGLRMPIFMSAGIYRVTPWKFFALDGFAAMISVPVWIYVGYIFGANLEELERGMRKFKFGFYTILAAIAAIIFVLWFMKNRVVKRRLSEIEQEAHKPRPGVASAPIATLAKEDAARLKDPRAGGG